QKPAARLEAPPADLLEDLQPTVGRPASTAPRLAGAGSALPTRAGRYVVQEEIARGGMGAVLRAFDPDIQRVLAVKVLLPEGRDPDGERRFLREAQITGRLQHPGIPPIHEMGRLDDGAPFFAMKLIEGRTLSAIIGDGSIPPGDPHFVGIFEQICRT